MIDGIASQYKLAHPQMKAASSDRLDEALSYFAKKEDEDDDTTTD